MYQSNNYVKAREVAEKFQDYPVISWRNMFKELAN
jgi:hypothetical protein